MERSSQAAKLAWDCAVDVAGGIHIALGTYNFAAEAQFQLFGTPIGLVSVLLNIPIALFCFRTLGRDFFLRSLRSILITSAIMDLAAPLLPVYTGDRLLAALCTGVLSGLGYAFIFMRGSSTGGTENCISNG